MIDTKTADDSSHRASRAETKAATRAKLMDAARDVFLTVGYQGATLDIIASKAGFTKGAVYWHFPNKQSLFLALVAGSIEDNLLTLESMVEQQAGDPDGLRSTLSRWIDGIDSRETLPIFGVELEIEARRDPSFRSLHQSLIGKHEEALASFLGHYFKAVGDKPCMPVDELSSTLITLFKGFALIRQNRPDLQVTSAKAVKVLLGLPVE